MFWLGFLLGVAMVLPFIWGRRSPPGASLPRTQAREAREAWERTRRFLYYDGTAATTEGNNTKGEAG